MNYWKHKMERASALDDEPKKVSTIFAEADQEGWELVAVTAASFGWDFFFKKPDFARELESRMEHMRLRLQAKQEAAEWMRDLEKPHTDQ